MYIFALIVSIVCLGLDQLTKYLVITNIEYGEQISVIDGLFSLTYEKNSGAAWGILQDKTWFLLAVTLILMIVGAGLLIKKTFDSKIMTWAIMLIISGGLGNMIDRIFRGGEVVDFIQTDFIDFPIFNFADCCITIGAGLVIIYFLIDMIKEVRGKGNNNPSSEKQDNA